jgi:hypothetical protein
VSWHIAVVGHLKPRLENAETVARRLALSFASLAELNPLFSGWMVYLDPARLGHVQDITVETFENGAILLTVIWAQGAGRR